MITDALLTGGKKIKIDLPDSVPCPERGKKVKVGSVIQIDTESKQNAPDTSSGKSIPSSYYGRDYDFSSGA